MFGVLDLTFVYWIAFGAVTVLIIRGANAWLADRGIRMSWWRWAILMLWYSAALAGIAAPFTIMGEHEVAAGWRFLTFNLPVIIISGFTVWRALKLGSKA
jgi:hypothetical protein